MRNKRMAFSAWGTVPGIVACLLCIMSSPVSALWVGQSQINPFLEIQGVYDSNIYRVSSDASEESDFITIISPGIHFGYPTTQNPPVQAVLDYRASIKIYGKDGDSTVDKNGELNTVNHHLGGSVLYKLASGWSVKGGYTFNANSNEPNGPSNALSSDGEESTVWDKRHPYVQHEPLAVIAYSFADQYKIELGYNGRFQAFSEKEDEQDDLTRNGFDATGFYKILPKVSILLGGEYAMIDRKQNDSNYSPVYDSNEIFAYTGAEYEATEKTSGILKVGWAFRDFDSGDADVEDPNDFYASGEMRSDYAEKSYWSLQLFRQYKDTSQSAQTANGAYYINSGVGGHITHTLAQLPKVSLDGSLLLSRNDFKDDPDAQDREDSKFNIGFGINYRFYKFVSLGASYTYDARDSNHDEFDFSDHLTMMKIQGLL